PQTCQVRISMTSVRDAIAEILDSMTLAEFATGAILPTEVSVEKRAG
ncbi:MAG TPA: Rrf2 family transcriptional regulator, partial [Sinorhizobium sp.]|nr:Rrf2 family transcriptional regulator [Sinorhizobium sp.]